MYQFDFKKHTSSDALDFIQNNATALSPCLLVATTTSLIIDRDSIDDFDENLYSGNNGNNGNNLLFKRIDYFKNFTALPRYAPSYGLLSLLSIVKALSSNSFPIEYVDLFALGVNGRQSCQAEIIDRFDDGKALVRFGCDESRFKEILQEKRPKVVGINCFTSAHHNDAINAAKIVRETTKNWPIPPKIVVGGTHPTILDEYFASHEYFDIVVRGEGEVTLLELLYAIYQDKELSNIQGITYKNGNGDVEQNPPRPLLDLEGMRSLPWIDRDAIPHINGEEVTSYYGMWHQGWLNREDKVADIQTSRGCLSKPEDCKHCVSGHLFGDIRRRSTNNLINEVSYLADKGYTIISDIADQVLYPLSDFRDFCRRMIAEGLNKKVTFWTPNGLFIDGLDALNELDKKMMIQAGYRDLCISIEGGPKYVSKVLNKPINVELVENNLKEFRRISKELGLAIKLRAFFMVGGPGCTNEYLEESMRFAENLVNQNLLDQVIPFIATPLPGSIFFDKTLENIREILSNGKSQAKLGHLFPNGDPEKKSYYQDIFRIENENQRYEFFEDNYIWPRLRYGMADLHSIYGLDPDYILKTVNYMANLSSDFARIG